MALVKRTYREWQLLLESYSEAEIIETALQIQDDEDKDNNVLVNICKTGLMSHATINEMLIAYIAAKDSSAITDYSDMLYDGVVIRRGVRLPHQKFKDKGKRPFICISDREYPKPEAFTLTVEDVWGKTEGNKKIHNGMIVTRTGQVCPYFRDVVPYRAVTVVCNDAQYKEVIYWLQQVHGKRCIINVKAIMEGKKLAIRSEEQN